MRNNKEKGYILIVVCVFIFISGILSLEMMRTVILERTMVLKFGKMFLDSGVRRNDKGGKLSPRQKPGSSHLELRGKQT